MSRWFRLHDEILDDPKVQKLTPADFKGWINLLCLASRNDGKLPPVDDIAFALRETPDAVSTLLERLLSAGLIDKRSGGADGSHYAPHKWDERQYKSDTSTARVKRFRERSKTATETPPETETETDTKDKSLVPAQRANRLPRDFEVPGDWVAWAMADRGWSRGDTEAEAASFIDYWHAKSGRDATKLDWQATWRNWCRNSRRQAQRLRPAVPL